MSVCETPAPVISVVIPVKDGGQSFRRCLQAIQSQKVREEIEIVVVDSGSTDGTREVARSFGARVHEIPSSEFNHGGTRNLGAELARGETIAFTVDDALPIGDGWLESLTAPLREESRLAGTYSRQVPNEDAPAHLRHYIEFRYGPTPRVQRAGSAAELTVATTLFSNVSSAIRRSVLGEIPFSDHIVTGEDLDWCGRVLLAGYEVAYVPDSVVRHSHRFTLASTFRRYFDQGAAAERTVLRAGPSSSRAVRSEGIRLVGRELAWMWRSGERRAIPYTIAWDATRYAGFRLGVHHRALPPSLRRRLSNVPSHWSAAEEAGGATPTRSSPEA